MSTVLSNKALRRHFKVAGIALSIGAAADADGTKKYSGDNCFIDPKPNSKKTAKL